MELTESEKIEARNNGFILVGKTGAGKTTLINAAFNKVVGKVERSAKSVTKISSVYYYKLNNGKCICFIDTPGLSDAEKVDNKDIDLIHLNGISKIISDEKIHIKGILFLVNFQSERFDASEQDALLNYNKIFPLKSFWQHLVLIYTHYYVDQNGDETEEDMKILRKESNKEIFSQIMEKIKNVSDIIEYDNLKIQYFNSYSEPKKETQKIINDGNRKELQILLDELSNMEPLFNKIEIQHIKNHKWEENGKKFLGEVEIVGYFDFNNEPIKEIMNIVHSEELKVEIKVPPPSYTYQVCNVNYSSNGNLCYNTYNTSNSYYSKKSGGALKRLGKVVLGYALGGVIGAVFGLFK